MHTEKVKTDAQFGVRLPETKEHLQPPETGTGQEAFSPTPCGDSVALLTPWFQLPASKNSEGVNSCSFKSPCLWYFVWLP